MKLEILCHGYKERVNEQTKTINQMDSKMKTLSANLDKKEKLIDKICKAHREYNTKRYCCSLPVSNALMLLSLNFVFN